MSLADVEQGMTEFLGYRNIDRPVVIRAFRAARDLVPPVADFGRDIVDANQFRFFLIYVQHFVELCRWFAPCTPSSVGCSASASTDPQPVSRGCSVSSSDLCSVTVDFERFSSSLPLLRAWEVFGSSYDDLAAAPAKAFNEADVDGNGVMSFDEFTEWVLSRGLVALHLGGGDEAVRDRHDALRLLRSKSVPETARPAATGKGMPTLLQAPMAAVGARCRSDAALKASAPATVRRGGSISTSGATPGAVPTGQQRKGPPRLPHTASRLGAAAAGVASRVASTAARLTKTATSCPESQQQQQQRPLRHQAASTGSLAKTQRGSVPMTDAELRSKATAAAAIEQRARAAAKAAARSRNFVAATAKKSSILGRTGTMTRPGSIENLSVTNSVRRLSPTTADRLARPSTGPPSKSGSSPPSRPPSKSGSQPPSRPASRPTSPMSSRPVSPQSAQPRNWRECASEQSTPVRTPAATPGCPGRGPDLAHSASRRLSPRHAELSRQQTTFGSASRFGKADQPKLSSRASTGQIGPPMAFKPELRRRTLLNGPSTGSVRIPRM